MNENKERFPTCKQILGLALAVGALTAGQVAAIKFTDTSPRGAGGDMRAENPIEHFDPNIKSIIKSESYGRDGDHPSLKLEQTLPDGTEVTIRKPVFAGEVAIHEPGDKVVPSQLEKPLP